MSIIKQVDADYEGDGMVAFIDSTPRYRKGPNVWDECVTGETYRVEIHRKPLDASARAFKFCPHEHREIDGAVRCAKRLMRSLRGRIPTHFAFRLNEGNVERPTMARRRPPRTGHKGRRFEE